GAADVHAVGGDVDALRAVGLPATPDARPGEGPLAGILTAFAVVDHDVAVILATDLPWMDAATVRALAAAVADPAVAVAVAVADRMEPLCAAWRVSRCRSVVESL